MKKKQKPKRFYLWEDNRPPKLIEVLDGREDTAKKPEIPTQSKFAAAHQRQLDEEQRRRQKHHGRKPL